MVDLIGMERKSSSSSRQEGERCRINVENGKEETKKAKRDMNLQENKLLCVCSEEEVICNRKIVI